MLSRIKEFLQIQRDRLLPKCLNLQVFSQISVIFIFRQASHGKHCPAAVFHSEVEVTMHQVFLQLSATFILSFHVTHYLMLYDLTHLNYSFKFNYKFRLPLVCLVLFILGNLIQMKSNERGPLTEHLLLSDNTC